MKNDETLGSTIDMGKDFNLHAVSEKRPSTEHWHPCEPLEQIYKGRRYYTGSAVFIFFDGRQVLRKVVPVGLTIREVLDQTIEAVRELNRGQVRP